MHLFVFLFSVSFMLLKQLYLSNTHNTVNCANSISTGQSTQYDYWKQLIVILTYENDWTTGIARIYW